MDKKAVAEIRRLLTKEHCRIDRIGGCFVGEDNEVIMQLKETFLAMPEEDTEKYCELLRKILSGKLGKNLYNMEFPLQEEVVGGKQEAMYSLVRDGFDDPQCIRDFCDRIIENVTMEGRYLILLARGSYDIPARTSDGLDLDDASDYVYVFMIGAICPVREVKEGLCYDEETLSFVNRRTDLGVQMPEAGFLFPAFNDRLPDIHQVLYYVKKEDERHPELIDGIIGADMPVTQKDQQVMFTDLVETTLGRNCDFESVRSLTDAVNEMIREDKDSPEPLELGRSQVRSILYDIGADDQALDSFDENFDSAVGEGNTFLAESIGGRSVMEIKSPSIRISVKSDMTSMITSRIIDGREYLLIPVQDDVEVNGIRILPQRVRSNPEDE